MNKKIFISLFVISLFLLLDNALAGLDMKEGLWEITVKMEMEGMPMEMPAQTIRQCVKKEDPVPKISESGKGSDKDCKFTSKQIKGDSVSWKAECRDKEGVTTMIGRITYRGTTFDGIQEIREDGELIMKSKVSGKWIGQCK